MPKIEMNEESALIALVSYNKNPAFFILSNEVIDVSMKALEKQIPKKPIYSEFDKNELEEIIPYKAECPFCRYEFEFGTWNDENNHHCVCGQKMDWAMEKEKT